MEIMRELTGIVKWIKLFGNEYLGFWGMGLVLFILQEIPYMIMPLFKLETNPIMNMYESSVILNICEKIFGSLCIALMIFVVHRDAVMFSISEKSEKIFFVLAIGVLLANFIGWSLYFTGYKSIFVMMFFIVSLPPLYYVFIGAWRKNVSLVFAGGIFLIVHFIHVLGNLKIG